jgi:hypothetical protein
LYFLIGILASLQSEFSLTPAGAKNPGHVSTIAPHLVMRDDMGYFLREESIEASPERSSRVQADEPPVEGYPAS